MRFAYTYRSSDGQRHMAEIDAESRDAAFAAIRREMGVKPIRVVAAGGADARPRGRTHRRAALLAAALLCAAGGAAWWAARHASAPYRVMTPQGPVICTEAVPLMRQMIPGDRRRIEEAMEEGAFAHPAERFLARFAEPGRPVSRDGGRPAAADFAAALREPVRVASTDFTEVVDLKRIVAGMKREMRAYLAGGGSAEQYVSELERRQRLEISYRENAERRLLEMMGGQDAHTAEGLRAAYGYWLKANARLQAMGIWPLPLPDALRSYQMDFGIDE